MAKKNKIKGKVTLGTKGAVSKGATQSVKQPAFSNKTQLKIELLSNLIPGSGTGSGNNVDNDITFDDYGFPYIGARRIKGILKESALELQDFGILEDGFIDTFFGNDEQESIQFSLSNAYLSNYEEMRKEIDSFNPSVKRYAGKNDVLDYYTGVHYQTAIDGTTGKSKDGSLRNSRAINKGEVFYADFNYAKKYKDQLEMILKNVSHMGLNRTRGYGEVQLSLVTIPSSMKKLSEYPGIKEMNNDGEYTLDLHLTNLSQIRISNSSGEDSLDYIPGSAMLGYFANVNTEISNFNELFMEGAIRFSNAYISDDSWNEYVPVKASWIKEKGGEYYYDLGINAIPDTVVKASVKNKYIHQDKNNKYLLETKKEMVYHHRRPVDKSFGHVVSNSEQDAGTFYQNEVISANQHFITHITGKGSDLKQILKNADSTITIGTSKNVQYGNVKVESITVNEVKVPEVKGTKKPMYNTVKKVKNGTKVACELVSPLFMKGEDQFSNLDLTNLAQVLHISDPKYYVAYTTIGGYNSKWQLQKPTYQVFNQGTVVVGTLDSNVEQDAYYGELVNEGYGHVVYEDISNVKENKFSVESYAKQDGSNTIINYTKNILHNAAYNKMNLDMLDEIYENTVHFTTLSTSLNNRLLNTLLQSESWEEFNGAISGIENSTNFGNRKTKIDDLIKEIKGECDVVYGKHRKCIDPTSYSIDQFYYDTLKNYLVKRKIEKRKVLGEEK